MGYSKKDREYIWGHGGRVCASGSSCHPKPPLNGCLDYITGMLE